MASVGDSGLVLVHSPHVGPLTWRAVADQLSKQGWPTAVADLTGALAGPPPYQPRLAQTVAETAATLDYPVVLVGHSGAGPLLPGLAAALPRPARALVYVDAGLPHPGRSWFQTAPEALAGHLRGLATDGRLPPWHEWFPPGTLAELLPEPRLREEFAQELSSRPLAYFHEPMPDVAWSGLYGYLLLSEAYREQAQQAAAEGAPVVEAISHHLAPLTSPAAVTARINELLDILVP